MTKIGEFTELISTKIKAEDIAKEYLKNLEIDKLYKNYLGRSFKNIIENYRDNKIDELCRDFIVYIETILNYHIGENLKHYKKLCCNYENQYIEYNYKGGDSEYILAIKKLKTDILNYNYIDDKSFSFYKKLTLFLIFNFANHHHILSSTIYFYKVRNAISHGFQNPNFCRPKKKNYNITKGNIQTNLNEILNIISYCSTAVNRKGYLKKLLQVSPEKIKVNKYLLTNTLKKDQIRALNKDIKNKAKMKNSEIKKQSKSKSTKEFSIGDLDNDYIDEVNFQSGKVNMDDIGKEIIDEMNFQSGKVNMNDIDKEILDEMNFQSGRINLDEIGKDILDEVNFQSGKVNMDDIGKEILDEINFQSGMLDSIEIEEIFKIINSNIQKIDTDDMIDIIHEIGEARKF